MPSMTGTTLQDTNMVDRCGGLQRCIDSPHQSEGVKQGKGPSRGSSHELKETRLETRLGIGLDTSYLQHRPQGQPKDGAGDRHI